MSNKIIHMTHARTGASALDEFLPEVDFQRASRNIHMEPREIHLEPVGVGRQPVEAPLSPIMVDSKTAQFWPMLAAALVGIGATILGLAAFSRFAQ